MGQEDVKKILIRNGSWLLAQEIAGKMDNSKGTVFRSLTILHKNGEIIRDKAINVIKDRNRINKTSVSAFAYRIK